MDEPYAFSTNIIHTRTNNKKYLASEFDEKFRNENIVGIIIIMRLFSKVVEVI